MSAALSTRQEGEHKTDADGDAEGLERVLLDVVGEVVVERGYFIANAVGHFSGCGEGVIGHAGGLRLQLMRSADAERLHAFGKTSQIFAKLGELRCHIGRIAVFEGLLDLVADAATHACHR
ncbi:hypothetical protein AGR7B_Lc90103 [Agrobacterium deltaense RV3]|nr:hypothetical protein AGR7B_Lc90103 [Agrobacterium deltaense RV3]